MPSELLTCVRKSPKIMNINQTESVVLKKISFAGVSAAAIALAVLCPSPARALNFNWTFTSGSGATVSGTINDLDEGPNIYSTTPRSYVVVTSATGGLGTTGIRNLPISIYNDSGTSQIFVSGGVPVSNGTSGYARFFGSQGSEFYDIYFTGNGGGGLFDMSVSGGEMMGMSYSEQSTTPQSFTAVPAPLPLLGLGAATAFSRKLKQRIAVRRKREEVIEAA